MDKMPRVGIGVLIFDRHNRILLGQRKASHGEFSWAPPGGHLEFGETLEECATREVLEETGLNIDKPEFVSLTNDVFTQEGKHYISIFMRVNHPHGQEVRNLEPHKIEQWQWFELHKLPENLFLPLTQLVAAQAYGTKTETLGYIAKTA
jgi:8-oxo-dGTP diphosphatase